MHCSFDNSWNHCAAVTAESSTVVSLENCCDSLPLEHSLTPGISTSINMSHTSQIIYTGHSFLAFTNVSNKYKYKFRRFAHTHTHTPRHDRSIVGTVLLQLSYYCNCLIATVFCAAIVSVSMLLLFCVFGCNFWTVLLSSWIFVSLLLLPLLLLLLSLLLCFLFSSLRFFLILYSLSLFSIVSLFHCFWYLSIFHACCHSCRR